MNQEITRLDCGHLADEGEEYGPVKADGTRERGWQFVNRDGKRICHECDSKRVLSCGHHPSPHSRMTTGTAWIGDGDDEREICCDCADKGQREAVARSVPGDKLYAYLSEDRKRVSTWTGGALLEVIRDWSCALSRQSFTHDRNGYRSITARAPDGSLWTGRGSAGICITMRKLKSTRP